MYNKVILIGRLTAVLLHEIVVQKRKNLTFNCCHENI